MTALGIVEVLEALLVEHDRIGSPLRRQLGPGLAADQVEGVVRGLGLAPPRSLIQLHGWHQVSVEPGAPRATWFWPAQPLTLDEAVDTYRTSIEINGIAIADLEELLRAGQPPEATFTGFWRTDWFPISFGENYAIECLDADLADAPVWRVNWHPDAGFETKQVAPSLEDLVERAVELFRAGAYWWDPEYESIRTVDSVFEARGLAEHLP